MPEPTESPKCICGCGEATKGGQFRPGHDAKYKSQLIKEAMAGGNPAALTVLEQRGWIKFLDKAMEVAGRPKAEPKVRKSRVPDMRAGEQLAIMKAASKVLKWTDQYRKGTVYSIKITVDNALDIAMREHPDLRLRTDGTQPEPFNAREQESIDAALADLQRTW